MLIEAAIVMAYIASVLLVLAVLSTVFIAYRILTNRAYIDELEYNVMALFDDMLTMQLPPAVLNFISDVDVANFEIRKEQAHKDFATNRKQNSIAYAEDISKQLSVKSQMYVDLGMSGGQRKKKTASLLNLDPKSGKHGQKVKDPALQTAIPRNIDEPNKASSLTAAKSKTDHASRPHTPTKSVRPIRSDRKIDSNENPRRKSDDKTARSKASLKKSPSFNRESKEKKLPDLDATQSQTTMSKIGVVASETDVKRQKRGKSHRNPSHRTQTATQPSEEDLNDAGMTFTSKKPTSSANPL